MLNLNKLYELITKLPVGAELESHLEQEINRQKQLFNNALKRRGLNTDDPSITPQQKSKIEQAKISHAVGLYKEMSQGLNICAREIENRIKLEGPSKESQAQLIAVQKQLDQISSKMGAYAKALQENQKTRDAELAKQREFDRRFIELERQKEKEKELKKEQEKAQQWDKLLGMLMPESWHESWQKKTQERLDVLEKDLKKDEGVSRTTKQLPNLLSVSAAMKKDAVNFVGALLGGSSIERGTPVEKQVLPVTREVQLRKEREAKEIAALHSVKPKV